MIPFSLIFAIMAFVGVILYREADDIYYQKIGLYIFLVCFLAMCLQANADFPSIGVAGAGIILFSVSLLMFSLLIDLIYLVIPAMKIAMNKRL